MTHDPRRRRRKHAHHEEEHENHERWLVSYADMVTLLMCLFIVLFAISQVDKAKFAALSHGLAEGFGNPMQILDQGTAAQDQGLASPMPPVLNLQREADIDGSGGPSALERQIEADVEQRRRDQVRREALAAYRDLARARARIDAALRRAGYERSARYQITERGLVVSVLTEPVLFDSARADLKPVGKRILDAIAPTLRQLPHNLAIEGHTNQLPLLPGSRWPSSWELSAYRATTVLRYLIQDRVPQSRMHAAGYGDTRPLIDPAKPAAVTQNRRVDIVVLSTASSEANALLPGLDHARSQRQPTPASAGHATPDSAH